MPSPAITTESAPRPDTDAGRDIFDNTPAKPARPAAALPMPAPNAPATAPTQAPPVTPTEAPPESRQPEPKPQRREFGGVRMLLATDENAKKDAGPAVAQKAAEPAGEPDDAPAALVARQRRVIVNRDAEHRLGLSEPAAEPAAEPIVRSDRRPGESKPAEHAEKLAPSADRPDAQTGPRVASRFRTGADDAAGATPAGPANEVADVKPADPAPADALDLAEREAALESSPADARPVQLLFVLVSAEDAEQRPVPAAPASAPAAPTPPGNDGACLERPHPCRLALQSIARG
jgi:hypothetical protein